MRWGVLLISAVLLGCAAPGGVKGTGPLHLTPYVAEGFARYLGEQGPHNFAVSEDGEAYFYVYCGYTACSRSLGTSYTIGRCQQRSGGVPCRIFAMDREVVWDGKVTGLPGAAAGETGAGGTQVAVGAFPRGPADVFRDCLECPEMVEIPAGRFVMGSPASEPGRKPDEGPTREVSVGGFALGKYEVTYDQYVACVRDGGCTGPRGNWRMARGKRPVIDVTWDDAQAYARWLSGKTGKAYRLPTEAEWEYAARAGTATPFWFGETIAPDQANYDGSRAYNGGPTGRAARATTPVGAYPANGFGLHDMHGNVLEWIEDCWHDDYTGAPRDGRAWTSGGDCGRRVLRGGYWEHPPGMLRSADRHAYVPGAHGRRHGFRIARSLDGEGGQP